MDHNFFMQEAIKEAYKAFAKNEVPIGAILVDQHNVIIARGYNQMEQKQSQLAHAEMIVLQKAARKVKSWRLNNLTLYVTVQPCMMCLGALYLSRVCKIVYGVISPKFGVAIDTALTPGIYKNLSMDIKCVENEKAKELLRLFFKKKRSEAHVKKK